MAQTNAMLNDVSNHTQATEGSLTKTVEKQTSKIPSMGFLGLALGAMAISLGLELFSGKRKDPATFVGLWVPTFLLFGLYNKLVKLEGSDHANEAKHIH